MDVNFPINVVDVASTNVVDGYTNSEATNITDCGTNYIVAISVTNSKQTNIIGTGAN